METESQGNDHPDREGPGPGPAQKSSLLRKMVPLPIVALAVIFAAAASSAATYTIGHPGPRPTGTGTAPTPHDTSAPATEPATSVSQPSSASPSIPPGSSIILMSSACKWAYPGQASGQIQGSAYPIVCLGTNGQVLGGFSGSHSLNAWCADPSHTSGASRPTPELANGAWVCTGSGSWPTSSPSAAQSQPAAAPSVAPSQPASSSAASRPPSGQVSVPIPMSAACKWAYPGQASGQIQGSAYSIACLGTNGQVLGGFGGAHSLNAWCADPRHTNGKHAPDPALIKGIWVCTT